nr:putative zinc finger, CCHC-type [Tanacetum cinerariifolium]
MPLNDPLLLTALKAQIQIGGTSQVNTFQATFHYQMAYRVQNHSLDILVSGQDNVGDALLIDVDSNATPTSPEFGRHENGLVEIKFSSSQPKSDNVFPTGIHIITPTDQDPAQEVKHIWWDVCNCESCLDEAAKIDDDEDPPRKRKSSQQKLKRRYEKEQRRLKPSARKEPTLLQESQSIPDVVTLTKTPDILSIQTVNPVSMFLNSLTQIDKPQNSQFIALVIKPQMYYEEFDNAESFEHLFMAEQENAESTV